MTRPGADRWESFTKAFLLVLALFIALNLGIWKFRTEVLFDNRYDGGDLARLGYVADSKQPRRNFDDLPIRHMELDDYQGQAIDLVTIGDSFAQGVGGGRNRFFQDYIATRNGFRVLNIRPYEAFGSFGTLILLANNGFLDRVRPRYVLLESAEKHCIEKFAVPFDFNAGMSRGSLEALERIRYRKPDLRLKVINDGNLKYLLYTFLRLFSPNAFCLRTYLVNLNRPFFSVKNADKLLFYDHDIKKIAEATDASVAHLNDNLNTLSDLLARRHIRLYFMPIVDKYNLYSDFIDDNTLPKSVFFEKLRALPRSYTLIDTKGLLMPAVRRGEKDVFYADDTHWSWKASDIVFRQVRFE